MKNLTAGQAIEIAKSSLEIIDVIDMQGKNTLNPNVHSMVIVQATGDEAEYYYPVGVSIPAYLAAEIEAGTVTPDEAVAYAVHFLSAYELAALLDKDSLSVPVHTAFVAAVGSRIEGEIDETEIVTRVKRFAQALEYMTQEISLDKETKAEEDMILTDSWEIAEKFVG